MAYTEIEERMDACLSLTLSHDPRAVDTAECILTNVLSGIGDPALMIRRGDVMDMNFIGASILGTYRNGMRLELDLRKAHPNMDGDAYEAGYWVVEGSAWANDDETIRRAQIEDSIGPTLPRSIETRVKAHLRGLIAACASTVISLVPRPGHTEESVLAHVRS